MKKFISRSVSIAMVLLATACSSSVEPKVDDGTCQQTYEFGNYGCARLVVIVDELDVAVPNLRRWSVRATTLNGSQGMSAGIASEPGPGVNRIEVIQFVRLPGDTQTEFPSWVSAKLIDDTNSRLSPLPIAAADSVMHVLKFAPVGTRPTVDTIRLKPKKL